MMLIAACWVVFVRRALPTFKLRHKAHQCGESYFVSLSNIGIAGTATLRYIPDDTM